MAYNALWIEKFRSRTVQLDSGFLVFKYLTQLLMNPPQAKISELGNWLPDRWKNRDVDRIANLNLHPAVNHPCGSRIAQPGSAVEP